MFMAPPRQGARAFEAGRGATVDLGRIRRDKVTRLLKGRFPAYLARVKADGVELLLGKTDKTTGRKAMKGLAVWHNLVRVWNSRSGEVSGKHWLILDL